MNGSGNQKPTDHGKNHSARAVSEPADPPHISRGWHISTQFIKTRLICFVRLRSGDNKQNDTYSDQQCQTARHVEYPRRPVLRGLNRPGFSGGSYL